MWIFLKNSFLSIVDKGDPTGKTLLVRARKAGDIEAVFADARVSEGLGTDYRYRARINRNEVAKRIAEEIGLITYANFKSAVCKHMRHEAYMDVWDSMYRFQQNEAR
ncbi:MAG TPA: hypothetical protein VFF81_04300 [Noviherbaspirillum sp.]|nr:hypothetical protein [Noviherbaspirillum sp.]